MTFLRRINDEQAERLLAGLGPDQNGAPDHGDVASFVRALALTVPADPGPRYEAELVPRLAETARVASRAADAAPMATLSEPGGRRVRPRLRFATAIAVAAALVPVSMTGLAFAGVTLPEPARSAFERVGIDLPNQAAVDESATAEETTGDESASSGEQNGGSDKANEGHGATKGDSKSGSFGKAHGHGRHGGNGNGASNANGGNSANAPGQQGTAPGLQETTPGQSDAAPPGQGGTPPGQTFEPAAPQGGGAPSSPPSQSKPE